MKRIKTNSLKACFAGFLLFFAGCAHKPEIKLCLNVGFDIDDTLLFSSPAFETGNRSGAEFYSEAYWEIVNKSDRGNSRVKKKVLEIVKKHQSDGDTIYVITARSGAGGGPLVEFIADEFGIKKENIYFEPEEKVHRIKSLKLDIFYGDSDSDIEAALEAGARPVRIKRAPESSYKKKYNPGRFNEEIIEGSEY